MKCLMNMIDSYYKQMENNVLHKMPDELLGTKYKIIKDIGKGTVSRVTIDKGIELSSWKSSSIIERSFDNRGFKDNIIEISYCFSGSLMVETLPDGKKYMVKEGNLCFYKMPNDVEYFKFHYGDFSGISIHMDLNTLKEFVNPICEHRVITELEELLNKVFSNDILIIDDAPFNIKAVIEEIRDISIENMMDYMAVKAKTIEFLVLALQYKINRFSESLDSREIDIIYRGETILLENLQHPPSVNDLAKELNISVYKLQRGFKAIFGNTVYEHIKKFRIEKSKELLKYTDMPIILIANEVGYENPSKFSSVFKSYMDMTPSEYRQRF